MSRAGEKFEGRRPQLILIENWIPAFAGMTGRKNTGDLTVPSPQRRGYIHTRPKPRLGTPPLLIDGKR
jgi:hypothetical protein